MTQLEDKIFEINSNEEFETLSLEIFRYQAKYSPVYTQYLSLMGVNASAVNKIDEIPFIPVSLFKTQEIITAGKQSKLLFTSSSTTGSIPSRHFVAEPEIYEKSFLKSFSIFYGDPRDYAILSLLPSYLEREGSSLVYMAKRLMEISACPYNGFYLYNHEELKKTLEKLRERGKKTILLGVSFALVDFAKDYKIEFPELIVMETGGMKGRGREMSRDEIHNAIKSSFNVENVHSEYGMAELLSQSYSKADGIFLSPPWKRVLIKDIYDPSKILGEGAKGKVNIIDLANIYSCSFIETEDMGMKTAGDSFKILGRLNNTELRGCNLLL